MDHGNMLPLMCRPQPMQATRPCKIVVAMCALRAVKSTLPHGVNVQKITQCIDNTLVGTRLFIKHKPHIVVHFGLACCVLAVVATVDLEGWHFSGVLWSFSGGG